MIASRGATMAVDWEQGVDYNRLRSDRLEKAKAALLASDLGALLLFDQNNIRYVTSTHIGEWARDTAGHIYEELRQHGLASDGRSAARIEEEVLVTADGPEILTRFPAEELLVAGRQYCRGADFVKQDGDAVIAR
jgi:Xaa-Pro aminopeptidase